MKELIDDKGDGALPTASATAAETTGSALRDGIANADKDCDIWDFARAAKKSILQLAPKDFQCGTSGPSLILTCTLTTREEMRAVREIIRLMGETMLPHAQGMETRQGGDGTAPSQDDSPVGATDAPNPHDRTAAKDR